MKELFDYLIILHVGGGTAGLITGSIAASVKKGSRPHLVSGKIFFYAMLLASISALVISRLPMHENIFLFAVGGFTLYMILTGWRVVLVKRSLKKQLAQNRWVDYVIGLFGAGFAVFLLIQSVQRLLGGDIFGLVPGAFGLVSLNYARMDYEWISGKKNIQQSWMGNHIVRMMGAMIASYTAFLVVNVQIQQQWILWLLPGLIGGILIGRFLKKYSPRKQ
jgi:hypothetical protein